MLKRSASRVIVVGERCPEHGALWQTAEQRMRGTADEYIGHVRIDTTPGGAVFINWHPLDVLPGTVPALTA